MSLGVYVLGSKCPGGKCPGGKCPGGICPWGSVRGVHVRGVHVLKPYSILIRAKMGRGGRTLGIHRVLHHTSLAPV